MTWLSWRQLRTQLAAGWLAVAAAASVFVLTHSALPAAGPGLFDQLTAFQRNLYVAGVIVVAVAPALIGAFWGAPLVARELENGTHQLVWQSVTRTRWLAVKLGLAALATAAAVGLLSLAVTWWSAALDGATAERSGSLPARLTPVSFAMRGIVPVGYAVFALVVGVLAGMLLRRTVPAMAVTLLVVVVAQVAAPLWVRPHLAPPVRETLVVSDTNLAGVGWRGADDSSFELEVRTPPGSWVLSSRLVDSAGRAATAMPAELARCFPPPGQEGRGPVPRERSEVAVCFRELAAAGYRQQLVYQPADRFWRLQWTETGMFLALAALLAWAGFVRIRRLS